jgi:tetratricopeptide (TPR) repeat protein
LLLMALVWLMTAGLPRVAWSAEPTDAERGRLHYKAGEEAFKEGRYDDAYREWEQGYKLSGRPRFLLNMAHAERRRGELARARALYRKYLVTDPETKVRADIEAVIAEIDAALAAEETAISAKSPTVVPPPATGAAFGQPFADDGSKAPGPGAAATPAAANPSPLPSPATLAADTTIDTVMSTGPAPTTAPVPLYRKWWFWAGVGGAAVAIGVTAALLVRGDSYTKAGSLGTVGGSP